MNIFSRTRNLVTVNLILAGLAVSTVHAQNITVQAQSIFVNGSSTPCPSATVTFGSGVININTAGCTGNPVASQPSISSVSPSSGQSGAQVTINGANLAGANVTIGGQAAGISSNTGTTITTSVPAGATAAGGGVVVTVPGLAPALFSFSVVSSSPVAPSAPTISQVTPASGSAGATVIINGSGFTGASVRIGGVTANITTSNATSITTTVPANAAVGAGTLVVTNATASASFAFAVNAVVAGCDDVSEDGIPLGCVSKQPTSVVASAARHNGLNGAGPEMNAYSMGATRCLTTPPLTKSWQHNIDLKEYKRNAIDVFLLNANESLSYKFTVPNSDTTGGFSYGEAAASGGSYPPVFMSITSAPCDFDTSKVASGPAQNFCYQSGIAGLAMGWTTVTGVSLPISYCRLKKGETYYWNIRFQDARPVSEGGSPTRDSCSSSPCGGVLQIL